MSATLHRSTSAHDVLPGDRPPGCYGMTTEGKFYSFEEQYGRPVILILAGADAVPKLTALFGDFAASLATFSARNADVLLVVDDNPRRLFQGDGPPLRTVDCGGFLDRCGVGPRDGLVLALDRNLRVALRLLLPAQQSDAIKTCLDSLDQMSHDSSSHAAQPAPTIVLPNLLPRDVCRSLIERFENSPTIDGEVARIDADGIVRSVIDHKKKHRRDMMIAPDEELHGMLRDTLLRRCVPEIAKAFQVHVSHTDRILISRYDDKGGWFRRHRDNVAENVAFREFALSLNLNTEDYAGGHLLFPEYNDHHYRPPTGGGVIFSTAILHEAAPVVRGCRYVLLTFFHSAAAEVRRQAYTARTSAG
ncbi:2OG-Fe(II) oxygenase family protein [Rhodopila sp.]|uniref:2OG-Fe(II) oxygenase family protein n=1 Tax=Rhodopila sp. TaxID=2480087 RepID=UPI003D12DC55